MHGINLKFFKIRRRAVVRTIDFLVSFTLFFIMLTQFFLIIINMNLNLASTSTKQENPAELLAEKLLGYAGTPNWGTSSSIPSNFGLASDYNHGMLGYYLDLAKLAHLNSELQFLSINTSYPFISPSTILSNLTGSQSNLEFRISTRPLIQVSATVSNTPTLATITVTTTTWNDVSLANVDINVFLVSLTDGSTLPVSNSVSDNNGQSVLTSTIVSGTNYVAIAYAHSLDSWGINWTPVQNDGGTGSISATNINSFSMSNPTLNSNSILQYANDANGFSINTASAYYFNHSFVAYTNTSVSSEINQIQANVGSKTPFIQVYTMDSGSNSYYYRVVTEPLIFNNFNYTSPASANYSASQFPAYQTTNFQINYSGILYTYSTPVMTDRGPILFTVDLSSS